MKTLKLIAIAICSLFMIGVLNSHAGSITFMYALAPDDSGDGANTSIYLSTDADIVYILWSVNGTERLSMYDEGTRWVEEDFLLTGHIKGTKYTAEAKVYFSDSGTDTDSHTFRVYKTIVTEGVGEHTGLEGYAAVHSQYFDGLAFGMSGSVYVYNDSEHTLFALGWFRCQEWSSENGNFIDEARDTKDPDTKFKPGETYYEYPTSWEVEFPQDGPLLPGEARYFNAHTHLQVSGKIDGKSRTDDWEADTRQQTGDTAVKFTDDDNPE